jgi:hypothetical protein
MEQITMNIMSFLTEKDTVILGTTSKVFRSKVDDMLNKHFAELVAIWSQEKSSSSSEEEDNAKSKKPQNKSNKKKNPNDIPGKKTE